MNIAFIANDTTYTYNLRMEVLEKLIKEGHQVTLLSQCLSHKEELEQIGCKLVSIQMNRRKVNLLDDIKLMCKYFQVLRKTKPDIALLCNIKPNVYAGLACRILGIRYVPNVTGLGTAVEFPSRIQKLIILLYKWGVAGASGILFQNMENMCFFKQRNMMPRRAKVYLLPGSGVNLESHPALPYSPENVVNFLFVARLLKEKGIDLYLSAAKRIRAHHPNAVFHICGGCDDSKYLEIIRAAETAGYIRYYGEQTDMLPFFRMAHCVVHPSYYPEGMSNVLLEAAACGRPVIATDRSGCRETVDPGISGYLIPTRDEESLVRALEDFLSLTWEERQNMGLAGRRKMEQEFDRSLVVQKYMEAVAECKAR